MMMGQEGTCWEERIHKEEDALQDFMEEWDTGLPNDIAQMEERQRQEAQSRAETAQSRLSDFAAQQKPENAQGRLSRVRWPPRSSPGQAARPSVPLTRVPVCVQQLWSKMVPTYDVDAMPGAMSEASAMNASVHDDEDALFDYFSSGKYAKGARTSLLFKVSHQRNNRLKTDFHDFVEANAKYGALEKMGLQKK